mgnify:CR=1 FL=1
MAFSFIVTLLAAMSVIYCVYLWMKAGMPFDSDDYLSFKRKNISYMGLAMMFGSVFVVALFDFYMCYVIAKDEIR